ncbi:geranylgeranyl transferase type-1 subunit beta [Mangifera indica]|uniref:geranylgeranyl transferase type-1 subunit beta n=1 Tax=Mangifera indica TaxID=29780 RepID=UPI001CFB8016|nr:geranylgeranyl transferase type-1 subunit beta [Mangifera indica]
MEPSTGREKDQIVSSDDEDDPVYEPLSTGALSYFDRERHVTYLEMMYQMVPHHYQTQEINRITLAYFAISGLHLLGALDRVDKEAVSNWVLSLQAHPRNEADLNSGELYGFHGSRSSQFPPDDNGVLTHNGSHLASTYCALAILRAVGYSFANIDRVSILTSMKNLQQPDGSFMPIHYGAEMDLRFIFCAAAICHMLEDWSGMNKEKAKDYILNCQSYDGGFGLTPGSESHGGGTYCAVASLRLMGFIEDDVLSKSMSSSIIDLPLLLNWCLERQRYDGGFEGRANKPSDTCYAFWIGAVLRILGGYKFIDKEALRRFLLSCQSKYGGFSKYQGLLPDLYHSYYGYTAFSLLEEPGLNPLCPELGMTDFSTLGI